MEGESKVQDLTASYEAGLEARDHTVPSGFVFRVRGINKAAWGEIQGSVPLLAFSGRENLTEEERKQNKERDDRIQRKIYSDYVDGMVDPSSGTVFPAPSFDKLRFSDLDSIVVFAMNGGGLDTKKAEQIARSL